MKKNGVKIGAAAVGVLVLVSAIGGIVAFEYQPTIQENVDVQGVAVGGLTIPQAEYKIRAWWEVQKRKPLQLVWKDHQDKFPTFTPSQLDVTVDDVATVGKLPVKSPVQLVAKLVGRGQNDTAPAFGIIYKHAGIDPTASYKKIEAVFPSPKPASISYVPGKGLIKVKEIAKTELDRSGMFGAVTAAENGNGTVDLPVTVAPKVITDSDLAQITDFVSSFTTHHPKTMFNRNGNIAAAARKINGTILLPGQEFSFNQTVGERTVGSGFRIATVFKNGKDAKGVGGGICQVSTTLYNACLLGNIQILERQNHSMPVGYVKLGRDATVDWGEIDLKFKNTMATPIAICSQIDSGSLTFRIFGKSVDGQTVKIERSPISEIPRTTEYVTDRHLAPGKTVVQDDGRTGLRIKTWRLVYKDGKLVSKQYLGQSYYRMHPRIVARGPGIYRPVPTSQPGPVKF